MFNRRSFLGFLASLPFIGWIFIKRSDFNKHTRVCVGTLDEIRQYMRDKKYVYLHTFYVTLMCGREAVVDTSDEMLRGCWLNGNTFDGRYLPYWQKSTGLSMAPAGKHSIREVAGCNFCHFTNWIDVSRCHWSMEVAV